MKLRSVLTISLLTVILLVACAPAESSTPVQPAATVQVVPSEAELPAPTSIEQVEAQPTPVRTQEQATVSTPTEVPQMVATPRGPNLEATDPSTVSLASGDLQLVEFFRFT